LEFMDTVRSAEKAIAAARRGDQVAEELDVAVLDSITGEEWRAAWPRPVATEPAPDQIPDPGPEHVPEPAPVEVPEPGPVEVPEPSPQQLGDERPVIEEEFPATEMPIITDTASNGQPNGVEPSVDHTQE
jgi:XTP/dITP diphosphohydrolase